MTRRQAKPIYSSRRWRRLRLRIIERADRRCQTCGGAGRLEVHHVTPVRDGGAVWDPDNLQVLCRRCHFEIEPVRKVPVTERHKWRMLIDHGAT